MQHRASVRVLTVSADGSILASADEHGVVVFWRLEGPEVLPVPLREEVRVGHPVGAACFLARTHIVLLGVTDFGVRALDAHTGRNLLLAESIRPEGWRCGIAYSGKRVVDCVFSCADLTDWPIESLRFYCFCVNTHVFSARSSAPRPEHSRNGGTGFGHSFSYLE
jgi:hypothetical protein